MFADLHSTYTHINAHKELSKFTYLLQADNNAKFYDRKSMSRQNFVLPPHHVYVTNTINLENNYKHEITHTDVIYVPFLMKIQKCIKMY
jgi:hypothetical protein